MANPSRPPASASTRPVSPADQALSPSPAAQRLPPSQFGTRRNRTSSRAARLAAPAAAYVATTSMYAVLKNPDALAAGGGNACSQIQEPGVDVLAENPDANQDYDRDGGDQQAVLNHVLTIFIAKKLP